MDKRERDILALLICIYSGMFICLIIGVSSLLERTIWQDIALVLGLLAEIIGNIILFKWKTYESRAKHRWARNYVDWNEIDDILNEYISETNHGECLYKMMHAAYEGPKT